MVLTPPNPSPEPDERVAAKDMERLLNPTVHSLPFAVKVGLKLVYAHALHQLVLIDGGLDSDFAGKYCNPRGSLPICTGYPRTPSKFLRLAKPCRSAYSDEPDFHCRQCVHDRWLTLLAR
jgi:hypothetical protein